MTQKVCIILPTYNEAENVKAVIVAIFACAKEIASHEMHVLVVDDNSPDGTQTIVQALMAHNANLHLITGEKKGLGAAYRNGLRYALEHLGPDLIFEMDADGQHDPAMIPLFVLLANHGFSLIIGSRFAPGGQTLNFAPHRKLISVAGNWMVRFFGGLPRIHDCTSGFRCIKAELIPKCNFESLSTRGYSFQASFLYELLRNGARVVEMPIVFSDRRHGQSKLALQDQIEFVLNIAKIRFKHSREFFHFWIIGLSGVAVNLLFYLWLTRAMGLHLALAAPLATEASIVSNFCLGKLMANAGQKGLNAFWGGLARFHRAAGIAGLTAYAVLLGLTSLLNIFDVKAILMGIGTGMIVNYYLNSLWAIRK